MLRVSIFSLSLAFVFTLGSSGLGQDAISDPSPPSNQITPDTIKPPATQSADKTQPSNGQSGAKPPLRQEHIIYLPFKNLRDVFEHENSSIVLPYAQFLDMWERLIKPDRKPIKPPVNGVIARADYVGSVKGELVNLEATLDVEVLGAEWARLPVQFGSVAIGSAKCEDGNVLLRGVGQGRYELLVQGKGKHQIKLSLVSGVKSSVEGRSFTVQCPAVGVSNLELEIPEKDLAVHVTPQRTSQQRSDAQNATHVSAVLGATSQFTVSWQPKSGSLDKAAGLANVTDTIAVDCGDGVVHTYATFDYRILRGALDELTIELPTTERLLDVQAPGLRDWKAETVEDRQRMTVRLHAPATEKIRLEIHAESPISKEAFQVGGVRVIGAALKAASWQCAAARTSVWNSWTASQSHASTQATYPRSCGKRAALSTNFSRPTINS